jgi:hypothetical protein
MSVLVGAEGLRAAQGRSGVKQSADLLGRMWVSFVRVAQ